MMGEDAPRCTSPPAKMTFPADLMLATAYAPRTEDKRADVHCPVEASYASTRGPEAKTAFAPAAAAATGPPAVGSVVTDHRPVAASYTSTACTVVSVTPPAKSALLATAIAPIPRRAWDNAAMAWARLGDAALGIAALGWSRVSSASITTGRI